MQKATALLSALFLTTACTEAIPEFFGDASSALAPQTSNKEISVFNETVVVSGSVNSAAINIEADLGGGYMNISAIDGGADIDFSDGNFSFSFDPSVYLSTVQGVESSHPGLLLRAEFLVDGVSTWSSDNNFTVDYVRPRVNFSLANSNAGEDDGTHTVNVTLDKASSMALSVNYNNTDNSATSGADYTGGSGTINFTIGQTSGSFNITLSPDVIGELDEDFDINFSAPSAELAIGVVHPTHNLTINENDAPTVHFNTTTDSGTEGDGATSVQVDLSNQADYPIIVNYSVMGDSTASTGTDYTGTSSDFTIPALNPVTYPLGFSLPDGDAIYEGSELLHLRLTSIDNSGPATMGANTDMNFTINDNETAPTFTFALASDNTNEDDGSGVMAIDVNLSPAAGVQTTVEVAVSGSVAAVNGPGAEDDYNYTTQTLTFNSGVTSQTLNVSLTDDTHRDSALETITFDLQNPTGGALDGGGTHVHTINDDEGDPRVSFTLGSSSIAESGGNAVLSVDLEFPSERNPNVNFNTVDLAATSAATEDYTNTSGALTFTYPSASENITVPISNPDNTYEENEDFRVDLSTPINTTIFNFGQHTVTINEDDPVPTINFALASDATGEDDGTKTLVLNLTNPSDTAITVDVTAIGGDAIGSGTDYNNLTGSTSFSVGSTVNDGGAISFDPIPEGLDDGDKTLILELQNPFPLTHAQVDATPANRQHTHTLTDNDGPPTISFGSGSSNVMENVAGGFIDIPVNLSNAGGADIFVDFVVGAGTNANDPGDYNFGTPSTLTFTTGITTQNIRVNLNNNTTGEPSELLRIDLQSPTGPHGGFGAFSTYNLTIDDDDTPDLDFAVASDATGEAGPANIVVQATNDTYADITFQLNVTGGTATTGTDYTAPAGTFTIPTGNTDVTIPIAFVNDNIDEDPSETFDLDIFNINGLANDGSTIPTHTHTIIDNDATPDLTFDVSSAITGEESGPAVIRVNASRESSNNMTFTLSHFGGTATAGGTDFTHDAGPHTITSGNTFIDINIPFNNDTDPEVDETIIFDITGVSNANDGGGTHTHTIADNDITPFTWTGAAGNNLWNDTGNWSNVTIPGSGDIAIFNNACAGANCNITINDTVNVEGFHIQSTYTGTITQGANAITVGSSHWIQLAGTFVGGSLNMIINGDLTVNNAAANFTATSGNTVVDGNLDFTNATFAHNGGTFNFGSATSATLNSDGEVFNHVTFNKDTSAGDVIIVGFFDVDGILNVSNNASTANIDGGAIRASANINFTDQGAGTGNTTILVNGSGSQTVNGSGGRIPNLDILSTGGIVTYTGTLEFSGNYTETSGLINGSAANAEFLGADKTLTLSGLRAFNDITFSMNSGNNVTYSGTLESLGDVYLSNNGGSAILGGGTLNIRGDLNSSAQGAGAAANVNYDFLGTAFHNINQAAGGDFGSGTISVNKSGGNISFTSNVSEIENMDFVTGTSVFMSGNNVTINNNLSTQIAPIFIYTGCGTLGFGSHTPANGSIIDGNNVTLNVADDTSTEDTDTHMEFVVSLSAANCGDTVFDIAHTPNTALLTSDYTVPVTTHTISAPATTYTINIPITPDGVGEPTEDFDIDIVNNNNANDGDLNATGTILDDDMDPYNWTGAVDGDWNNPGNWAGGNVPDTAGESPVFNSLCTVCNVNSTGWPGSPLTVGNITIEGSYTGTIDLPGGMTLNASSLDMQSGNTSTITLGAGNILNVNGTLDVTSGTLDIGNNSLNVLGVATVPNGGTISSTNATVTLDQGLTCGNSTTVDFYTEGTDLILNSANAATMDCLRAANNLTINKSGGNVSIVGVSNLWVAGDLTVNNVSFIDSGEISVEGDISVFNSNGGTGVIKANCTISCGTARIIAGSAGGVYPSLHFDTAAATNFFGLIELANDIIELPPNTGAINHNNVIVRFVGFGVSTIDFPNDAFYSIEYTKPLTGGLHIDGYAWVDKDFTFSPTGGTHPFTAVNDTQDGVVLTGDIQPARAQVNAMDGGDAWIEFSNLAGPRTIDLDGSTGALIPNVYIDDANLTTNLIGNIEILKNFQHKNGIINPGSSLIHFKSTSPNPGFFEMTGQPVNDVVFESNGENITIDDNSTILGDLNIDMTSSRIVSSSGTQVLNVAGDVTVTNNNAGVGSAVSITLDGTANQTITVTGGNFPEGNLEINKSSGEVLLASNLTLPGEFQNFLMSNGTLRLQGNSLDVGNIFQTASGFGQVYKDCGAIQQETHASAPATQNVAAGSYNSANLNIMDGNEVDLTMQDLAAQGEAAGLVNVTAQLNVNTCQNLVFTWNTQDNSAISTEDYVSDGGNFTINSGTNSQTVGVTITDDSIANEPVENFSVRAVTVPQEVNLLDADSVVPISDNESTPDVITSDITITEGQNAQVVIQLDGGLTSASDIHIDWNTADGTAVNGADYVTSSGTATIPANNTSVTLPSISTTDDAIQAGNKYFNVNLVSIGTGNASIGSPNQSVVTMLDANPPPLYRSVAVGASGALDTGGASHRLDMVNGVITFADQPVPNNVGVGDAIEIDTDDSDVIDGSDEIVFIYERISGNQFKVERFDGSIPSDTASNVEEQWRICRAYTSLANAEQGNENISCLDDDLEEFDVGDLNLTAINRAFYFAVYNSSTMETNNITFDGWITNSTNHIKIFAPKSPNHVGVSQRHRGFFEPMTAYTLDGQIRTGIDFIHIEGIQIQGNATGGAIQVLNTVNSGAIIKASHNIIRDGSAGAGSRRGIQAVSTPTAKTLHIWNNLIYGFNGTTSRGIFIDNTNDAYIYNNTVLDNLNGIHTVSAGMVLKNNISVNNSNVDYIHTIALVGGSTNNLSSDATAQGTSPFDNRQVKFIDDGNENYHLHPYEDSEAVAQGVDLSGDTFLPFNDDFDSEPRPSDLHNPSWTLGADNGDWDLGSSSGPDRLILEGPMSLSNNTCVEYKIIRANSNHEPVTHNNSTTIDLTATGSNDDFYLSSNCLPSEVVSSVEMSATDTELSVWYYNSSTGSSTITAQDNPTNFNPANMTLSINSNARGNLEILGTGDVPSGGCVEMEVRRLNSSGDVMVPNHSTIVELNHTITPGSADFFTDRFCNNFMLNSRFEMKAGEESAVFYVGGTGTGAGQINANDVATINNYGPGGHSVQLYSQSASTGHLAIVYEEFPSVKKVPLNNCIEVEILRLDHKGNPYVTGSNTDFDIDDGGAGITFRTDSTCSANQSGDYQIDPLDYRRIIHMDLAALPSPNPALLRAQFTTGSPTFNNSGNYRFEFYSPVEIQGQLRIVGLPQNILVDECVDAVAQRLDQNGYPLQLPTHTGLSFDFSSHAHTLFNGHGCSDGSAPQIPSNGTEVTFSFQSSNTGTPSLELNDAGPTSIQTSQSYPLNFYSTQGPGYLEVAAPQFVAESSCAVFKVRRFDQFGSLYSNTGSELINISASTVQGGLGGTSLFDNGTCSGGSIGVMSGGVPIEANEHEALFSMRFNPTSNAFVQISANFTGYENSAIEVFQVYQSTNPGPLRVSSATADEMSNNGCHPVIIERLDDYNQPMTDGAPTDITLNQTGSGQFWADAQCSSNNTNVTQIPPGQTQVTHYYQPNETGAPVNIMIDADRNCCSGLNFTDSMDFEIEVYDATAGPMQLTIASEIPNGQCTPVTIRRLDDRNYPFSVGTPLTSINMFKDASGGTLHSDPGCLTPDKSGSMEIQPNEYQATYFYMPSSTGNNNFHIPSVGSHSQSADVSSEVYTPVAGDYYLVVGDNERANSCFKITVQRHDDRGNPMVDMGQFSQFQLNQSSSFPFSTYANENCDPPGVTPIDRQIAAGDFQQDLYIKLDDSSTGSFDFHVQHDGGGLSFGDSMTYTSINIYPASTGDFIINAPSNLADDACVPVTISSLDDQGKLYPFSSFSDVDLNFGGPGGGELYYTNNCLSGSETPNPVTMRVPTNKHTSNTLYFKGNGSTNDLYTTNENNFNPAQTHQITFYSPAAGDFEIDAPFVATDGACVEISITRNDGQGNPMASETQSSNVDIIFNGGITGTVYNSDTCSTTSANPQIIPLFQSKITRWIVVNNTGSLDLEAQSSGGLSFGTDFFNIDVQSSIEDHLAVINTSIEKYTDECLPVWVERRNQFNQPVVDAGGNNTEVDFSFSAGSVYDNKASCDAGSPTLPGNRKSILDGTSKVLAWYRRGTPSNETFSPTDTGAGGTSFAAALPHDIEIYTATGPFQLRWVNYIPYAPQGSCVPMRIERVDGRGRPHYDGGTTTTISVSSTNGSFWQSSDCSTTPLPGPNDVLIGTTNTVTPVFYYNPTSTGNWFTFASDDATTYSAPSPARSITVY